MIALYQGYLTKLHANEVNRRFRSNAVHIISETLGICYGCCINVMYVCLYIDHCKDIFKNTSEDRRTNTSNDSHSLEVTYPVHHIEAVSLKQSITLLSIKHGTVY